MTTNNLCVLERLSSFEGLTLDLWGTLLTNDPQTKPRMFEQYRRIMGLHELPFEILDAGYRSADKYTDLINLTTGENYGLRERLTIALKLINCSPYSVDENLVEEHYSELSEAQDTIALQYPPRLVDKRIPELLKRLRSQGVRVAVASNTGSYPASLMRDLLDGPLGLADCFDYYGFSDELGIVKPFRSFYEQLLEGVGTAPMSTVHVGDNPKADGEGSRAMGMTSLYVHKAAEVPQERIGTVLEVLNLIKQGRDYQHLVGEAHHRNHDHINSPEIPEEKQENI